MLVSDTRRWSPRFRFILIAIAIIFSVLTFSTWLSPPHLISSLPLDNLIDPWTSDPSPISDISSDEHGYEAAIIYLVKEQDTLPLSLGLVHDNLPAVKPWPIILFHNGAYDDEHKREEVVEQAKREIKNANGDADEFMKRVVWERLEWTLPDGVSNDINVVQPVMKARWPAYHHMCAWFTSQVFHHPRIARLKYYLRLDTDSFIRKPLCNDPFELMAARNLTYMYRKSGPDAEVATVGMWDYMDSYAWQHPEVLNRMKANGWWWPPEWDKLHVGTGGSGWGKSRWGLRFPAYANNFEVVNLEQFRRPDVQAFLKDVMSMPIRTYKYRWGDAPLRYATVNMFFDLKTEVHQMCDIEYEHQGLMPATCECATV